MNLNGKVIQLKHITHYAPLNLFLYLAAESGLIDVILFSELTAQTLNT
jgi:hypothetical protein